MDRPPLCDGTGRLLAFGREIARGGEGSICLVEGRDGVLAKLFLQPPSVAKQRKLRALTANPPPARLATVAAWPTTLITDPAGGIRGLLMPRLTAYLGSDRLMLAPGRKANFPNADWHFIVHVARNLAAAVETVHESGFVIGDLNDGSYLIREASGEIGLVDIDSIQVVNGGTVLPCEVGKPLFTPPELHQTDFSRCVRTPNHDAFALAILIFQLLFLGRHPFAGRPLTPVEIPPEQAVRELRFAYGKGAASLGMARPPNIIGLDALNPRLAELFEQAFAEAGKLAGGRPSAGVWRIALEQQLGSMRACKANTGHTYASVISDCPWCRIETEAHAVLFARLYSTNTTAGRISVNLEVLVREIQAFTVEEPLPQPLPIPAASAAVGLPPPAQMQAQGRRKLLVLAGVVGAGVLAIFLTHAVGVVLAVVLFATVLSFRRSTMEVMVYGQRREAVTQAQGQLKLLSVRWQVEASGKGCADLKQALDGLVREWTALEGTRQADLADLEALARANQLSDHLARASLQIATIPSLSPGRRTMLLSYGISSAAEIEPAILTSLPGLTPALIDELLAWRRSCESSFVFAADFSRTQLREEVNARFAERHRSLTDRLIAGLAELRAVTGALAQKRASLSIALATAQVELAQREADFAVMQRWMRFPFGSWR